LQLEQVFGGAHAKLLHGRLVLFPAEARGQTLG
jgi:hypothetical protein